MKLPNQITFSWKLKVFHEFLEIHEESGAKIWPHCSSWDSKEDHRLDPDLGAHRIPESQI